MTGTKIRNVFHMAIATHDLDEAEKFYVDILGASKARRYKDRVTFNFFEHQIVCHLSPDKIDKEPELYPRHFGITFTNEDEFDSLYTGIKQKKWPLFKELSIRFLDLPEKHKMFFILDPSNNVIEFKHYEDSIFRY